MEKDKTNVLSKMDKSAKMKYLEQMSPGKKLQNHSKKRRKNQLSGKNNIPKEIDFHKITIKKEAFIKRSRTLYPT